VKAAMVAMAKIFKQSFIGGILCNAEPEEAYLKIRVHESIFLRLTGSTPYPAACDRFA
jgi:hypothetical protein